MEAAAAGPVEAQQFDLLGGDSAWLPETASASLHRAQALW